MTKIYTKTGDKGETSLFNGQRIPKDDAFMHALGTVDECSSVIGLAISYLNKEKGVTAIIDQLIEIQHALLDLGAAMATPRNRSSEAKVKKTRFGKEGIETLETWIDEIDHELPPLKNFILPGGHPAASTLHVARNICRRAERHAIPLHNHAAINDNVVIYLNRLSDYLFMLTRLINKKTNCEETMWEHKISATD